MLIFTLASLTKFSNFSILICQDLLGIAHMVCLGLFWITVLFGVALLCSPGPMWALHRFELIWFVLGLYSYIPSLLGH